MLLIFEVFGRIEVNQAEDDSSKRRYLGLLNSICIREWGHSYWRKYTYDEEKIGTNQTEIRLGTGTVKTETHDTIRTVISKRI